MCLALLKSNFPTALLFLIICSVGSGLTFNFYLSKTRLNCFCSLVLTLVQTHFQTLNIKSRWLTKDEHWGLLVLSKTTGNRGCCQAYNCQLSHRNLVNILVSQPFQSSKLSKNLQFPKITNVPGAYHIYMCLQVPTNTL